MLEDEESKQRFWDFTPFEFETTSHPKYYADVCINKPKEECSYKDYEIKFGN